MVLPQAAPCALQQQTFSHVYLPSLRLLEKMVIVCSRRQFARIHETGIDNWARRVYVHSTPEADGSNLESGRSAERRRAWGQTWSCRRSALSRSSRSGPSTAVLAGIPRIPHTRMIGAGATRADVGQSRITQ